MSPCNFICLLKPKYGKLTQIEVRFHRFGGGVVLLLLFVCFIFMIYKKKKGASISVLHTGGMYSFTNTFMFIA